MTPFFTAGTLGRHASFASPYSWRSIKDSVVLMILPAPARSSRSILPDFTNARNIINQLSTGQVLANTMPCLVVPPQGMTARSVGRIPMKAGILDSEVHARLLPKEIFREPFGLPKIKVESPSHNFRSPELITD